VADTFDEREEARGEAGDERAMRAHGRRQEGEHKRAYREGHDEGRRQSRERRFGAFRRGDKPQRYASEGELDESGDLQSTYELGFEDAMRSERRTAGGGLLDKARNTRPAWWIEDGAGFVLGLIAYSLLLAYLRGGPDAVKGWLKAKFLNQPYKGQLAHPPAPSSPTGPSGPSSPSSPTGPAGQSVLPFAISPFPMAPFGAGAPDVVGVTASTMPSLADLIALSSPLAPTVGR
jgi:hypothetical protein